ncbi:MAG TPA: FAD-binding and (Fe-S)-binding domain-containing protein, partial [Thermoanaerobaculia bacterium]
MTNASELAESLRRTLRGEVRFDDGSRALYATDASNYRQVPIGVVIPRDVDDIVAAVALAREFGAPVLPRGGGTSLAGQCCNVAIVIDTSKFVNRILEIDPVKRVARVEPGIILDTLRDAAEAHQLTFAPDPATHSRCTIGGMIGNNSCGVHSIMGGKTDDNVETLDVLTYDGLRMTVGPTSEDELQQIVREGGRRGEIYASLLALRNRYAARIRERFPDIPRRVSGFNLNQLLPENGFHVARALVGTEGTCAVVLGARLRLVPSPPKRALLVIGYPDVYLAADDVPNVLEGGPIGLEGMDDLLVNDMKAKGLYRTNIAMLPEGGGWLLAEFGGETQAEANARAQALMVKLQRSVRPPNLRLFDDPLDQKKMWQIRESGLGATAFVPGKGHTWEGWEDAAVAPARLGSYLRDLRALFREFGYRGDFYGHFGHGCVHTRIDFDLESHDGVRKMRAFVEAAADLVVSHGGSLSGEHGDGQSRGELLPKMFGPELMEAFREFKRIWDPDWKMNPGKVIQPNRLDENLRLGGDYDPWKPKTHFQFPEDQGSMAAATLRCVGVGACRRLDGGTMCPSFMVTREEKHSTRGRAHLLWEMFRGDVLPSDWQSEPAKEALDLCLACKGCKSECPVGVDMATYKAEFLAHYYKGRMRPLHAYAMGMIYWWARAASLAPGVANFLTHAPLLSSMMKSIGGIAKERTMPRFAPETFRSWFFRRPTTDHGQRTTKVILWADTFSNFFHPEIARATVHVLEAAGFDVIVPRESLCCGRPLYDYGMLDLAKRLLEK